MKTNLKKFLVAAIALTMIFSLSACGNSTSEESSETYVVVTSPAFPPFDTTDEDGNITGFDMDLITAIGKDQGFDVEFKSMEFDSLIPAIEAGNADIIAAGMNAEDPARQAKVDFSDTYYESGIVVLVNSDNDEINSIDDLTKDMKVGSQIGTTGAAKCDELYDDGKIGESVIMNQFTTCVLQLKNGDIDAIIVDKPVAESFVKKDKDGSCKIVGDTLNAESFGFAVQKGNDELREKINEGLKNCIENGTYDEIFAEWIESEEE